MPDWADVVGLGLGVGEREAADPQPESDHVGPIGNAKRLIIAAARRCARPRCQPVTRGRAFPFVGSGARCKTALCASFSVTTMVRSVRSADSSTMWKETHD